MFSSLDHRTESCILKLSIVTVYNGKKADCQKKESETVDEIQTIKDDTANIQLSFSNPCVTSNDKKDGCCYNADPTEEVYCNRKDTYCYKYPNDFNYRAS